MMIAPEPRTYWYLPHECKALRVREDTSVPAPPLALDKEHLFTSFREVGE